MKFIVGLGNPGSRYETTRHNVGFLAIDRLCDLYKATSMKRSFQAEVFEATIAGEKTLLIKPQTYMNLSGESVGSILRFYKGNPSDLIVIQDEVDLPPLAVRLKTGGGTGGHNGLKSIDSALGDLGNQYHRIRIGVGKPMSEEIQKDVSDHVLSRFTDQELKNLDSVLDQVSEIVKLVIQGKNSEAMNLYHRTERKKPDGI